MVTTTALTLAADDPAGAGSPTPAVPTVTPASGGVARWRDVAVGAAFEAEVATAKVIAGLRGASAERRQLVVRLAEQGALARRRSRQWATATVQGAVVTLATSPVAGSVVDRQLERLLRPVVLAVLNEVLYLLETEPERIPSLIWGQRDSTVDELVTRIRLGTAAGETVVDRLTFRVFPGDPRQGPPSQQLAGRP
jgi:hypothetical protein